MAKLGSFGSEFLICCTQEGLRTPESSEGIRAVFRLQEGRHITVSWYSLIETFIVSWVSLTWLAASCRTCGFKKRDRRESQNIFYVLILSVTNHHFCHTLLVTSESLHWVQIRERKINHHFNSYTKNLVDIFQNHHTLKSFITSPESWVDQERRMTLGHREVRLDISSFSLLWISLLAV